MASRTSLMRVSPAFRKAIYTVVAKEMMRSGRKPTTAKVTDAILKIINQDVLWHEFIKL